MKEAGPLKNFPVLLLSENFVEVSCYTSVFNQIITCLPITVIFLLCIQPSCRWL